MATIYNSDLTKELIDGAKIQLSRDKVPNQIADKVVPVMEVNPKMLRRTNFVFSGRRESSGGSTLVTTDSVKDTYITGIIFSMTKDATCDMATASNIGVSFVVDGATKNFIMCSNLTLTAQSLTSNFTFENPMKVDRNSAILIISNSYTAGTMQRTATVVGYTVDNAGA